MSKQISIKGNSNSVKGDSERIEVLGDSNTVGSSSKDGRVLGEGNLFGTIDDSSKQPSVELFDVFGDYGLGIRTGERSNCANKSTEAGSFQTGEIVLKADTLEGGADVEMKTARLTTISIEERMNMAFQIEYVAVVETGSGKGKSNYYRHDVVARRASGGNVVLDHNRSSLIYNGIGTGAAELTISADTTNNVVKFTAEALGSGKGDAKHIALVRFTQIRI
tara:strand:- start:1913 stop:2575 length:663 start_codon:yes stop_codon:yes gene_type:complete